MFRLRLRHTWLPRTPSATQLDKIKNLHSQIRSGPVVGFSSHTVSDEGLPRAGLGGH